MSNLRLKRCSDCKQFKPFKDFWKNKSNRDGLQSYCKICNIVKIKEYNNKYPNKKKLSDRKWAKKNPEKVREKVRKFRKKNHEKTRRWVREWQKKNREKTREYAKQYRKTNPTKKKEWQENNRAKVNKYQRERMLNVKNRLNNRISVAIWRSLKGNKKRNHWEDLVCYNLQDLIIHLEKQFKDGMNWNNYGKWHIDHIQPISNFNFNLIDDADFKNCWALENLQPLWAKDNLSKGAKFN